MKNDHTILVILTDDYEIFGNGSGDIDNCLIRPTDKLLKVCQKYEVPVTLFVDVAEYWAFEQEEEKKTLPEGYMPATKMRNQMIEAVQLGHDVQLHLHPQWLNYKYDIRKGWQVDINLWRLPSLTYGDYHNRKSILGALYQGKKTLEDMLKPFQQDYECIAFRAGAWCIQPEFQVLKGLEQVGIKIDSTVLPGYFHSDGITMYDFRKLVTVFRKRPYWYLNGSLMDSYSEYGNLIELPILVVSNFIYRMLVSKIKRQFLGLNNFPSLCGGMALSDQLRKEQFYPVRLFSKIMKILKGQAAVQMMDFTSISADEMCNAIKKTKKMYQGAFDKIPVVFIGHSKMLAGGNLKELESFIVNVKGTGVLFGRYKDVLDSAVKNGES